MQGRRKARRAWLAFALWAGVIFFFSAQKADVSSAQSGVFAHFLEELLTARSGDAFILRGETLYEALDFLVRKAAHFGVYFVLGALCGRAYGLSGVGARAMRLTLSVLTCALYAATDEIHQYFVPGRAMMLTDVLLDSVGAFCGAAVWLRRQLPGDGGEQGR